MINIDTNTQVISRTAPRLIDLFAALATGLAGAFATGRRDVSDTLPGVAIAISLVPPLANVGILLATDRSDLAFGSLLLFVTNYMAILLTGSFMFSVMGYPKAYHALHSPRTKRTAVALAAMLLALILIPLTAASQKVIRTSIVEHRTAAAAKSWLAGSDYRMVSVNASDDGVQVIISGEGMRPPEGSLQDALRGKIFELRNANATLSGSISGQEGTSYQQSVAMRPLYGSTSRSKSKRTSGWTNSACGDESPPNRWLQECGAALATLNCRFERLTTECLRLCRRIVTSDFEPPGCLALAASTSSLIMQGLDPFLLICCRCAVSVARWLESIMCRTASAINFMKSNGFWLLRGVWD